MKSTESIVAADYRKSFWRGVTACSVHIVAAHQRVSNPVKHHYVTQHVLRRFCDSSGVLWTYDKQKRRIYRAPPVSQARGKHFYSFKGRDGLDSTTIELKFLRKIDNDGCVAIERLLHREK